MSEVKTVTLAEFLTARLNEDEAAALGCMSREPGFREGPRAGHWVAEDPDKGTPKAGRFGRVATVGITVVAWPDHAEHIARHDPARVLAEVEAKRHIIRGADRPGDPAGAAAMDFVLHMLARPYSDHPDYREEWKP